MPMTRIGTWILGTAHRVELLVEQSSTFSTMSVARTALELRNERTVKILVPWAKLRFWRSIRPGSATATLCTTWTLMLPSFFSSFSGRFVALTASTVGSRS